MFGSILLAVTTLMHLYVFWRIASVPWAEGRVPRRRYIAGAGVLLWAILVVGRFCGHGGEGAAAAAIETVGMTWLGTLFLLTVCLLAADIATCFGKLFPRAAPSVRALALGTGVALAVVALVLGARAPEVENYEARLAGLPGTLDGAVVVAMSDLHLGPGQDGEWLARRVAEVNALRPTIIVLLGDIFEGHEAPQAAWIASLGELKAPLGVYAVSGNHESHGGAESGLLRLEESGIQVLRNRWVEVRPGLVLAGVDDPGIGRRPADGGGSIVRALSGRPQAASILVKHSPWPVDSAAAAGAGLMLCGHTHGGQIWPLGYLTRMFFPYFDGEYDVDGMKLIVCRGTGTWGPRMRLWHPSEIVRVTLRTAGTDEGAAPESRGAAALR